MTAPTFTIPKPEEVRAAALLAIPGYGQTDERISRLERFDQSQLGDLRALISEREADLKTAITQLSDGVDVDAYAIAREIRDLESEAGIVQRVIDAANFQRQTLRQKRGVLDTAARNSALRFLNDVVQGIAREVRALDRQLGSIRSVDDALRGTPEQLAAWQKLDQHVATVESARATQRSLLTSGQDDEAPARMDQMTRVGLLADAFDRDRYWVNRRNEIARVEHDAPTKHAAYVRWLAPWESFHAADLQAPLNHRDKHAQLRWESVNAHPWVPTIERMEAALKAASASLQITGLPHAHAYYEITDMTPVTPLPALPNGSTATSGMTWNQYKRADRLPERRFG